MELELLKIEERIRTGLELGESHFREFKSALQRQPNGNLNARNFKDICKNIGEVLVAFANADGGELYIGVEDDGSISGIPHDQALIESMLTSYVNYVHLETPLPSPIAHQIIIDGKTIIYFNVAKSTTQVHITSDGRCLQRFDKENRPVPFERIQFERREQISLEYDRAFIYGATMLDLDIDLIDSVAKQLAQGYSPEKLLQFLGLSEYGPGGLKLRRAALLLFANDIRKWHPRCEVRIMRISGVELGVGASYNVIMDDTIIGNITHIVETAWETLRPHLARTRFRPDALFRESIIYPEITCKEALINAIAHRDYSLEGLPIELFIYDDRMEIKSPGGLLSSISIEDLIQLKRAHQSRNVYISRVLRELGYMREMGEGMSRIFSTMREFDLIDPELMIEKDSFKVTLHHKSIFSPKDVEWLKGYKDFELTKNEQRVVLLGRDGHLLSTNEIIKTLGIVDTDDFRALYQNMNRKGIIYNVKPKLAQGGGRRREIGRFLIVPPQEAHQYLEELLRIIISFGPQLELTNDHLAILEYRLSPNSPYNKYILACLQNLGLINAQRRFLPKARALWGQVLADQIQPAEVKYGKLIMKKHLEGYGFILGDDGVDYFLHASNLVPPLKFGQLEVGIGLVFKVSQINIPGKPRPAIQVSIKE